MSPVTAAPGRTRLAATRRGPTAGVAVLAALVLGGCAATPATATHTTPAPLDLVAYLCADACRVVLPAADPVPYHAGAPATRTGNGFEVRYQQRSDGRWAPMAHGRLALGRGTNQGALPVADYAAADGLTGCWSPVAEVDVRIRRRDELTCIDISADREVATALTRHLAHALVFAEGLATADPAAAPCCSRHAALQASTLVHLAGANAHSGMLLRARDRLRDALALDPQRCELHYQIGELDRALGQDTLAADRLNLASLRASDPAGRAAAAAARGASDRRSGRDDRAGEQLRADSTTSLAAGEFESAAALAHAAMAASPDPIADLQLRHRLQRERKDRAGALGTALLLREYGADPDVERLLAEDFTHLGQWQLARRAAGRQLLAALPTTDLLATIQAASIEVATNALQNWLAPQAMLATPPR